MPELPEVETVVRHLKPELVGQKIISFNIIWPKVLEKIEYKTFSDHIIGQKIDDVFRRAKFIILKLENGYIPIHLRMTGKLYPNIVLPDVKHISATFELSDKFLVFQDTRKFGRIYWVDSWPEFERKNGMEPFEDTFTERWLFEGLQKRKRQIKALLLDQQFISGLGNIYVDEALWSARIHPITISNSISRIKSNRLYKAIKTILAKAIEYNGTTFINFTFKEGVPGSYREKLFIFDHEGHECKRCNKIISKIRVAGRGTYICTHCQKF